MQERPAYLLVADELRQQILSGHYEPGARMPTMEELRRAYGVSEIVIRHAVSLLRLEGLVETRRGGGTVVRTRPQVRRRAMERYAVDARQAAERYATDTGQVIEPRTSFTEDHATEWPEYQLTTHYSEVPADEELAALFGAAPETPCSEGTSCSMRVENRNRSALTTCPWTSWRAPPWLTPHASHGQAERSPSWPSSVILSHGWRSRSAGGCQLSRKRWPCGSRRESRFSRSSGG